MVLELAGVLALGGHRAGGAQGLGGFGGLAAGGEEHVGADTAAGGVLVPFGAHGGEEMGHGVGEVVSGAVAHEGGVERVRVLAHLPGALRSEAVPVVVELVDGCHRGVGVGALQLEAGAAAVDLGDQ